MSVHCRLLDSIQSIVNDITNLLHHDFFIMSIIYSKHFVRMNLFLFNLIKLYLPNNINLDYKFIFYRKYLWREFFFFFLPN